MTCWQPRSLPAVDVIVLKPLPNVRRNHRRHGQCPACSGPELLHLQTRKHISVNILSARHVRQKQIHVPLGKEKEKPAHKRHVGALTRARRPNLHHRHVVRVQENQCVMPFLAPAMDGDRHGKQLQDIDMISAEGGGPRRVKPFQTEHRAKPHPARVGSKPECRRGDGRRREESPPVPAGQEVHPPRDVRAGRRGEADVLRQGRDRHRQIDKPPEENAAPTDHLAREGKHSDQRQQLPQGAFLPRPPRGQAIAKPCKFVRREAHLLKRGVQGDPQELEAASRQGQLLRRERDTEVAAEDLESLQVAGARSMRGPRQKIIIEAAPANVYGNPVKRLRELSKNEGGRAGSKRVPEGDVYPLFPRVAQERPIRGPHRAEAEGVADVRLVLRAGSMPCVGAPVQKPPREGKWVDGKHVDQPPRQDRPRGNLDSIEKADSLPDLFKSLNPSVDNQFVSEPVCVCV